MNQYINKVGYGLSEALPNLAPRPIQAKRAPVASDTGYLPGTLWVNLLTSSVYVLASIAAGVATWQLLQVGGGAGVFASLVVTPGPVSLTGTTTINTSGAANTSIGTGTNTGVVAIGSGNSTSVLITAPIVTVDGSAAGVLSFGPSLTTGTISIGGSAQTGTLTIAGGNAAQTVNISASGTGAKAINIGANGSVDVVNIGSVTGASQTVVKAGTAGLALNSAGQTSMDFLTDVVASPTATTVINARQAYATYTGFTTAAAGSQVFTITNSKVTAGSSVIATVNNLGANDAQMTMTRVVPGAGTIAITCQNLGAQALNGDVNITLLVLD